MRLLLLCLTCLALNSRAWSSLPVQAVTPAAQASPHCHCPDAAPVQDCAHASCCISMLSNTLPLVAAAPIRPLPPATHLRVSLNSVSLPVPERPPRSA
ncbi:hypothetical protein KSF73_01250 [Burkholderiaceae bacterium DAT-1]|nr:hypothetical protein [Burkholderiaceae bacterium DAT-1]